ncbi:hypothetical protein PR003_g29250 [Phytophthora rubi]|uniref:Uncharacterized protein n=2 Tax=Phytophthora rubi TaxID=129364 RepID=A0A6A4BKI7_9STRA|nr:hypothetical protein PR001_g23277 [Phytophthora rubi]KAE9275740.1 hypothetical protein PR003_g29250 [Phytophthora rubi]
MSWMANRLMFYHLNRPQHTQLDVVEFLQGAKYAIKTTRTAMYSREFADFLVRERAAPGAFEPDCDAAKMLQQTLDPISYAAFKDFVLEYESIGAGSVVKEIEVHSAHLESVQYERVPKRSTTNSSGAKVLGVPVHE